MTGLLISIPIFLHSLVSLSQSSSPNSYFICATGAKLQTCCIPGSTQGLLGSECHIPDFALLQNHLLYLGKAASPSAVTPVAQMSLHRDQGPSQGSSVGTLPCHLVWLLSCTPQPQVSKQFINDNQVCLVIPHWEECESTENNCLHLFLVLPCFPMGGWCWEMVKSSLSDKGCPEGPLGRDFITLKSLVSGQCL